MSGGSTDSSPGGARMRSESGRLLTAEERQAILLRFRSVSEDHLFPNQSHLLLPRSSQPRRLTHSRQTSDAGGADDSATATMTAATDSQGTGSHQPHPPRSSSGGGVVIGQLTKPGNASSSSIRPNKSESSLTTMVHAKAYASAVRRGVTPSPLKFAAARAMSRRQMSQSNSSLTSLGSTVSSSSGAHLVRTASSASTSPGASVGGDGGGGGVGGGGGGGGGGGDGSAESHEGAVSGGGLGGVPSERQSLAWLSPDDIDQRKVFLAALIRQGHPLPRSELDYHAARVFIDLENRSVCVAYRARGTV
jgi:hypothetical protein